MKDELEKMEYCMKISVFRRFLHLNQLSKLNNYDERYEISVDPFYTKSQMHKAETTRVISSINKSEI